MTNQASEQAKKLKLTKEEQQTLYNPGTYGVTRVNQNVYSLRSEWTGLVFYVKKTPAGFKVWSPTGTLWDVTSKNECNCPDYWRAEKLQRFCKHQAVVLAVVQFEERERTRKPLEETRNELKEMFR